MLGINTQVDIIKFSFEKFRLKKFKKIKVPQMVHLRSMGAKYETWNKPHC